MDATAGGRGRGAAAGRRPGRRRSRSSWSGARRRANRCRILGIDPPRHTGFGIVDGNSGPERSGGCSVIDVARGEVAERPHRASTTVSVLRALRPDEVAIERVFVKPQRRQRWKLGQAMAARRWRRLGATRGVQYAPRGEAFLHRASAAPTRRRSRTWSAQPLSLGVDVAIPTDATDALIALCHAHARRVAAFTQGQRRHRSSRGGGGDRIAARYPGTRSPPQLLLGSAASAATRGADVTFYGLPAPPAGYGC